MPTDKRFSAAVPGPIIKIRLATTDVMSAIDMAEALGLNKPGMSLAQVCKWGIVGALWRLRQSGELPEHDGFEYANMISRYENNAANRKALVAMEMGGANELALRAGRFAASAERSASADPFEELSPRFARRPADLRLRSAAVVELDQRVMSTVLASERANLTPRERALWLLNSPSAESWEMFFGIEEFNAAASEVLAHWPAAANDLHALRDQPRSAVD